MRDRNDLQRELWWVGFCGIPGLKRETWGTLRLVCDALLRWGICFLCVDLHIEAVVLVLNRGEGLQCHCAGGGFRLPVG